MADAKLVATIEADANPMQRGLDRAEAMVEKTGHKLAKKLSKSFGAGMMAGVIAHGVKEVLMAPFEKAAEIKEKAKDLGITGEEYQMLEAAAEAAGMSVDKFVESLNEQDIGADTAIAALEKYRSQIKLTADDLDNLSKSNPFKQAAEKVTQWTAKGLRLFQNFAAVMMDPYITWDQAMADEANQALNAKADSKMPSKGLRALFKPKHEIQSIPERNREWKLAALQLTQHQQAGAFVGAKSDLIAPALEMKDLLKEVRNEVKSVNEKVSQVLNQ